MLLYFSKSNYIKSKTLRIISLLISYFYNFSNNSPKIVITLSSLNLFASFLSAFSLYIINIIVTLGFRFILLLSWYINNFNNPDNSAAVALNLNSPSSSFLFIRSWYCYPVAREEKNKEDILLFILLDLRNIDPIYIL